MNKAGVVGLGQIGGGVAACLARAGMLAGTYDVRADASDKWEGVSKPLASPAELGKLCDTVLIAVVSAQQAEDVLNGPDGLLSTLARDSTVILLSTVSLEDLKRIRSLTEAAGVGLVDCGVTGGPRSAQNGLVCLAGGDEATLAKAAPVLDGFAKKVVYMGGPGAGMAAKIARNVIVYNVWMAGHEGARLARAAGIDVRKLADAIDASAEAVAGPALWMNRPTDPDGDAQEKALREHVVVMLEKDLGAALELAESLHVSLPVAQASLKEANVMVGLKSE